MSIRFQLRRLAAAVCLFVQLLALPQAKSQQPGSAQISPPVDQYSEDSVNRWITGQFFLPAVDSAWRLERCLGLGPAAAGANDWFSMADGENGAPYDALFTDNQFSYLSATPSLPARLGVRLQLLPQLIAGQIDPSQIQASMCVVLFACRYSDGSLQIKGWRNQASFGINFTQNQFDLRRPNGSPPLRFYATATVHPNDSNGLPVFLNLDLFGLGGSQPQEFGDSGGVKNWLLQGLSQFQTNFNIPYPTTPPVPPEPVTFDQRSFFRLKCYPAPADANGNDIPDVYEATFQDLFISEVCYFNTTLPPDPQNATSQQIFPDWVELYNPTANDIDLERYAISDSANDIKKHRFYGGTVPSGGYARYYCSGLSRDLIPDPGPLHIAFQLKNEGEHLYLSRTFDEEFTRDATYQIIDELDIPNSRKPPTHPLANITFGRCIEGNSVVTKYFIKPTPQDANPNVGSTYIAREPRAVEAATVETTQTPIKGGLHETGDSVVVALLPGEPDFPGTTIVYTLDASEPKSNSTVYTQPITISRTTVLRFRAFQPDSIPSSVITRTFIFPQDVLGQQQYLHHSATAGAPEADHLAMIAAYGYNGYPGETEDPKGIVAELARIPTVCLCTSLYKLSDPNNVYDSIDESASFEWIDPALPATYDQENCRLDKVGGVSLRAAIKGNLELTFTKSASLNGADKWQGPKDSSQESLIFPGSPVTAFNKLRLRAPYQNAWATQPGSIASYVSDAFLKANAKAFGQLNIERRWVHIYLNGTYYGVTDLSEHVDEEFIACHMAYKDPVNASSWVAANIRLLNLNDESWSGSSEVGLAWANLVSKAADAAVDPYSASKWQAFLDGINLDDFVSLMATICMSQVDDFDAFQSRSWYNLALGGKFHFLAWDGDLGLSNNLTVNPESPYLESFNAEDYYAPWYVNYILRRSHQTGTPGYFVHPTYAQLFKSKINDKISNQGPLANGKSNARFLVLKEQFRRVIHSEGFRWHGTPERVGEWMDFTNNAPNWLVDAEIGFKTQLQHAGLWSSD